MRNLNGKKPPRKDALPGGNTPDTLGAEAGTPMDVSLLQRIVQLMAANDLSTVDVRDGDRRIILKRGGPAPVMVPMAAAAPALTAAPSLPAAAAAGAASGEATLTPIKSPMVGTYYSKPGPDAKPFVAVGSAVSEETDVCLIEAMKTFNNVKAGCRGTIARILVQDGEVVQFDTVLFLVRPG
jgi:acetyl-CoA carboxylase biotin carboxyl carrier protein